MTRRLDRRTFLKGSAVAGLAAATGGILQACASAVSSPSGAASAAPTAAGSAASIAPSASAAAAPVTLRLWSVWGGTREPLLKQILVDYQKLHPNITVVPKLTSFDVWTQEQLTAVAGNDVPELSMGSPVDVPQFAKAGALLPLTPYLTRDGVDLTKVLYPAEAELTQYNGEAYILPMPTNGAANIMFYNTALFEAAGLDPNAPPKTWDELKAAALKITKREGNRISTNGITILGTNPIINDFKHWLVTNDGHWLSDDAKTVQFNDAKGQETMAFLVDFAESVYGGWANVAATGTAQEEVIWQNLYAGHEAMYVSGPWMFALIRDNAPEVFKTLAVGSRPTHGSTNVGGVIGDGVGMWLLKGNKYPDEAWDLLQYLTIGAGGAAFLRAQARPSPVIAVNEDPAFAQGNTFWPAITDVMKNEKALPRTGVNSKLDAIGLTMLEEALFKKKSPTDALDHGAEQAQKILDEYWAS